MHGHGKHIPETANAVMAGAASACDGLSSGAEEYSGDAALLVLIEVEEWRPPGNYLMRNCRMAAQAPDPAYEQRAVVGLITAPSGSKD